MTRIVEVATTTGTARAHLDGREPAAAPHLLVLGHGAGGGVEAVDLLAARDAAVRLGWAVVRVEQPWRVRGRRVAEAPARLDQAWLEVCRNLLDRRAPGRLVLGGRSAGARVACRTAAALGAAGVLCLAFPLRPPGRRAAGAPPPSRQHELDAVGVPLLVVQGTRDAFGVPEGSVSVQGADHAFRVLRADPPARPQVEQAVRTWLQTLT